MLDPSLVSRTQVRLKGGCCGYDEKDSFKLAFLLG
ncbi:hypothetical protein Q426_06140 [Streptococcus equi subsp. zooepidemicus CY]|nr:hypothetical protein Q426_06140 [Streptococcus equi subsp. zooepidemicus CY]